MISHLRGKILLKKENFVILEVGKIGYKVFLSPKTLNKITKNNQLLKVFTYLYLREETAELYGFLTLKELELFEILNEISGIGPKTALSLADFGSLENLKKIMEEEEEKFFQEIKGIGKKKMQKILLELTGKIKQLTQKSTPIDEALEALVSLGFPRQKAKQALEQISKEIEETDKRIKEALKILGKR